MTRGPYTVRVPPASRGRRVEPDILASMYGPGPSPDFGGGSAWKWAVHGLRAVNAITKTACRRHSWGPLRLSVAPLGHHARAHPRRDRPEIYRVVAAAGMGRLRPVGNAECGGRGAATCQSVWPGTSVWFLRQFPLRAVQKARTTPGLETRAAQTTQPSHAMTPRSIWTSFSATTLAASACASAVWAPVSSRCPVWPADCPWPARSQRRPRPRRPAVRPGWLRTGRPRRRFRPARC